MITLLTSNRLSQILLYFLSCSDVDSVVCDQTISDVGSTFIPVEKTPSRIGSLAREIWHKPLMISLTSSFRGKHGFKKKGNEMNEWKKFFVVQESLRNIKRASTSWKQREFDLDKELTFQSVSAFLPYSSHPCCSWSGCRLLITDRRIFFLNNKKSRHQSRIKEIRTISTRWDT